MTAAAWLSIASALWLLVGNTWMSRMHWGEMHDGMMHSFRPFLWHEHFMGSYFPAMSWPFPGVLAGLAMLICGVLLATVPAQRVLWGALMIVTSALVLSMSMGGLIPGILGIVAGAIAVAPGGSPASRSDGGDRPS
jgi:hypothetical protein